MEIVWQLVSAGKVEKKLWSAKNVKWILDCSEGDSQESRVCLEEPLELILLQPAEHFLKNVPSLFEQFLD